MTIAIVALVALALGCNTAVDQPVRQALLHDVIGDDLLASGVGLSMTMMSMSGAVGPALAALVISLWGVGTCFLLNAASFVAVLVALAMMRARSFLSWSVQHRSADEAERDSGTY